jgi:hypothetical protein
MSRNNFHSNRNNARVQFCMLRAESCRNVHLSLRRSNLISRYRKIPPRMEPECVSSFQKPLNGFNNNNNNNNNNNCVLLRQRVIVKLRRFK